MLCYVIYAKVEEVGIKGEKEVWVQEKYLDSQLNIDRA